MRLGTREIEGLIELVLSGWCCYTEPICLTGVQGTLDHFGHWFTWCQSCRHGGHANHMAEWFG